MRIKIPEIQKPYEKIHFHVKWLYYCRIIKLSNLRSGFITCSRTFWLHIVNISLPSHGSVATFMVCNISFLATFMDCNISLLISFHHICWIMILTDHKYHFSAMALDLSTFMTNTFIHYHIISQLGAKLFIPLIRPIIIQIQ